MDIIFLNPHADDFLATPVSFALLKRRALKKYGYLFNELLKKDKKINIFIDATLSSLIPERIFNKLPKFLRKLILRIELKRWLRINKLDEKVIIHWQHKTCSDIKALFMFSYKSARHPFSARKKILAKFPLVLSHLSHYMVATSEKAANLSELSNLVLVGDSDIKSNGYFQKYFFWYQQPILVLPFCVQERFKATIPFEHRKKKCIATGSFHDLSDEIPERYYSDFREYFQVNSYHPVRELLYSVKDQSKSWLTCLINPYRPKSERRSFLKTLLSHFRVSQKKYFSIDIVAEYNQHQFALVGEELNGFPALGAFEAMACGALLLARAESYYQGLGLQPNEHYVLHDGTVDGIKKLVQKMIERQADAEKIANNGKALVGQKMRGDFSFQKLAAFIDQTTRGM